MSDILIAKLKRVWNRVLIEAKRQGGAAGSFVSVRVELVHIDAPGRILAAGPQTLHTYPISPGEDFEAAALEWLQDAREQADLHGGKHKFELVFLVGQDVAERLAFPLISETPLPGPAPIPMVSPAPAGAQGQPPPPPPQPAYPYAPPHVENQAGALVQAFSMLARHQQATFDFLFKGWGQILNHTSAETARLSGRVTHLEAERTMLIMAQEEVLFTRAERDMMATQTERQEKRKDALFEQLLTLGTALGNQYARGKGGVVRSKVRSYAFKRFVEGMTSEKLDEVMKTLDPEQQILLADVIASVLDEVDEDKKSKGNGVNGAANPANSNTNGSGGTA